MQSKHAFIVALMAGAGALLVVFGGLLSISFLKAAEPYLGMREAKQQNKIGMMPKIVPHFTTKIEGGSAQIVEVDGAGQTLRVLYTSDLNDPIADFSLFAVPQERYAGKIYVQSVQDAEGATLIVYPLSVETGKMEPAVINTASNHATLSPQQDRVAIISTSPNTSIAAYDLITGDQLAVWVLQTHERLSEKPTYSRSYNGEGVHWVSNSCFDHAIWVDNVMEIRSFCINGGL